MTQRGFEDKLCECLSFKLINFGKNAKERPTHTPLLVYGGSPSQVRVIFSPGREQIEKPSSGTKGGLESKLCNVHVHCEAFYAILLSDLARDRRKLCS